MEGDDESPQRLRREEMGPWVGFGFGFVFGPSLAGLVSDVVA